MRNHEIKPSLQEVLNKLSKKDKVMYERVLKKIEEIISCSDIDHYKNLRHDMKDRKRVHLGHFVLVFKFFKESDTLSFVDFAQWGLRQEFSRQFSERHETLGILPAQAAVDKKTHRSVHVYTQFTLHKVFTDV